MLFFIYSPDKADHWNVRQETRPDHIEFLKKYWGNLVCAGPTLSDDGEIMDGSVLIVYFPDKAAVEAFVNEDPYKKADLFESTTIKSFKQVAPAVE